jgi:glycine cleavage system H protein
VRPVVLSGRRLGDGDKAIVFMNVPDELYYAPTHEWLRLDGENGTVGITDHAQHELTDVVYVELPQTGATVKAQQQVCVIESVKAASDIYSPISGTITDVNTGLTANPALLNTDPYGEGWIFRIKLEAGEEIENLKTGAQYRKLIESAGDSTGL